MLLVETKSFIPSFLINFKLRYDNKITGCWLDIDSTDYNFDKNYFINNGLIKNEFKFNSIGNIRNKESVYSKKINPYIDLPDTLTEYSMDKFYEIIKTSFDYFEIKVSEFYVNYYYTCYLTRDFLFTNSYHRSNSGYLMAFKVFNKKTRTFNWIKRTNKLKKILKILPEKVININSNSILLLDDVSSNTNWFYEMYNETKTKYNLYDVISKLRNEDPDNDVIQELILKPNSEYVNENVIDELSLFNFSPSMYTGTFPNEVTFFIF